MKGISDGLIVVVKSDCPTCTLILPALEQLDRSEECLTLLCQDGLGPFGRLSQLVDDSDLERSFLLKIEAVPTLIRWQDGQETDRLVGWQREEWRAFTGLTDLGTELPAYRPGCGAKNVEPDLALKLEAKFRADRLRSRRVDLAPLEDDIEACFDRDWSDGLPVVPPTPARVLAMLKGTSRDPGDLLGEVPPNMGKCTVEKAAINAVMSGCLPQHFHIVLAAVEAALDEAFCLHGILATTYFSGPAIIVNGPAAKAAGMNWGINALGQGCRANATIGRALQLIVRNVGGGKPGQVDRAVLGNPGKYSFCFAENQVDSPWEPLSVERGFPSEASTVTVFAADGVQAVVDQASRNPESMARSFAACLRTVAHPKLAGMADALLVVSPEHGKVFERAGWKKDRLREELDQLLTLDGEELARGYGGIDEGMPPAACEGKVSKFRSGGLLIVHAGGPAGLFSAVIGGWLASGPKGSQPVTREIEA